MRKLKKWMLAAILICGASVFTACTSNKDDDPAPSTPKNEQSEATDYSDKNNWMNLPEVTKEVDCFYVYPTEYVDDSHRTFSFFTVLPFIYEHSALILNNWFVFYNLFPYICEQN